MTMAFFEKSPKLYQILAVLLCGAGLFIATGNFYGYATSPTDENWFTTPPSPLYVHRGFPALLNQMDFIDDQLATPRQDSIRVGDLVLFINGRSTYDLDALHQQLAEIPPDSVIRFDVFRPRDNLDFDYQVTRSAIPDSFVTELGATALVYDVIQGGTSEKAGMQRGDLIVRVNDQAFEDIYDADQIIKETASGDVVAYEVLRNSRYLTLRVEIANIGVQLPVLLLIICGLTYVGVGLFLALRRPERVAARLIATAFLLMGFSLLTAFKRDGDPATFAAVRDFASLAGMVLGVAAWLHSWNHFPKRRPELLKYPWQTLVLYGLALLAIPLFATEALNQGEAGLFAIGLMLAYFLVQRVVYWKQRSVEYTKLNRTIAWTAGIVFVLSFLLQGPIFDIGEVARLGSVGILFIFIPLSYLYTIGHYRLLGLDFEVRRNIQYTLLTLIWGLALAGICIFILLRLADLELNFPNLHFTGNTFEIRDSPLPEGRRILFQNVILMFLAVALAFAFWKMRQIGQKFLDEKYFRGLYNYQRAANQVAEALEKTLDMEELAQSLVHKLAVVMHINRVGILIFRTDKSLRCSEAHGFKDTEWQAFSSDVEDTIVDVMQRYSSETRFSVDYLPESLRRQFQTQGFRHIIPIRSKDKLIGILNIGGKLSEAPFNQEDLAFFHGTAKQLSVSIENAFLYEQLAIQERFKLELEIARKIQLESLPQSTPILDHLEIAGISIPATEVGGDYFDYLNGFPDSVTIIVGDVSGKGTSAALYMSKVQGIMRSLQSFDLSPRELFVRANVLLCNDLEKKSFITAIGVSIRANHREMILARAGHLPLYHYRAKAKKTDYIIPKGLGLGLDNAGIFAAELEEKKIRYESGDIFLLITDGITEARDKRGEEYGDENLNDLLESAKNKAADEIRDEIITSVRHFTGNSSQHDDQTVVVVKAL